MLIEIYKSIFRFLEENHEEIYGKTTDKGKIETFNKLIEENKNLQQNLTNRDNHFTVEPIVDKDTFELILKFKKEILTTQRNLKMFLFLKKYQNEYFITTIIPEIIKYVRTEISHKNVDDLLQSIISKNTKSKRSSDKQTKEDDNVFIDKKDIEKEIISPLQNSKIDEIYKSFKEIGDELISEYEYGKPGRKKQNHSTEQNSFH